MIDPNAPQPQNPDERTSRRLRELEDRIRRLEDELARFRREVNVNGHA